MEIKRVAAAMALVGGTLQVQAQELPQWLVTAQARESKLPAMATVASEDGWLRTQVPGTVRHRVLKEEGSYSLEIEAGGDVKVSCEVYPEPKDLASHMRHLADAAFESLAKANGTIEYRAVEASDAGVVGPHGYMSLRWIYRANRDGERRVGGLKQFVARVDQSTVHCMNDDLGYVRTFEAVAKALAANLRSEGESPLKVFFREVSVASMDGVRIGLMVSTLARDADGDTKVVNGGALLVQTAPGQLVAQDTSNVEWVRPDGSLINAIQVQSANGALSEDAALQREEGKWRVSGTLKGKPLNQELATAPASYVEQARSRRELMGRAKPIGAQAQAEVWSSLDLTRLLPTRVTVLAAAGADAYAVREEIGTLALEATLDRRTGTLASVKMAMGPRTLTFERVLRQGDMQP